MRKLIAFAAIFGLLFIGSQTAFAQEGSVQDAADAVGQVADDAGQQIEENAKKATQMADKATKKAAPGEKKEQVNDLHQDIMKNFIEGGPIFMSFVLICLLLGLALCIERIIYLNLASSNSKKLLDKVNDALNSGGVEAAKEVCRNESGPVASIFYQGLERSNEEIDLIEKSVSDYGGVQMGLLEKGLSWISLFIALAPMLGFMGTVIGMIGAFEDIAAANTISAGVVAGGIKIALITTVSGLIVAIILQIFYNYILSKIDSIVLDMENASIELVDMLYRNKLTRMK